MAPRISVVTPAYNARSFIRDTIDSVLGQSVRDLEMIVVDDGSNDGTAAIARSVGDARLSVLSTPNRGVSLARNTGLAACRAPFVIFLDADDILVPDALERMTAALQGHPAQVACVAHHRKIAEDGSDLPGPAAIDLGRFPTSDTLRHLLAKNLVVTGGCLVIRTAHARAIGGFDPKLRLGEDWEFWCRLAMLGDFVPLPDFASVRYRLRSSGANHKLRGTPMRPNFEAVDAIYRIPGLDERFSPDDLRRLRRLAELDAYWGAARNAFAQRRMTVFGQYLGVGLFRYPDSLLHPRLIYRFLSGASRMISSRRELRA